MRIDLQVHSADRARIPATGPVVVVANHPYGVFDGALLTVLLTCSPRRQGSYQLSPRRHS
jgi:putative hemolysin